MAAFGIRGQFFAEVTIAGKPYPLSLQSFEEISVIENTNAYVPMCKLVLIDKIGFLASATPVTEGTKIDIRIGNDERGDRESTAPMHFVAFGNPKHAPTDTSENKFTIYGVLDVMKYWRAKPSGSFKGTSSGAIADLAQKAGLTDIDLVNTNDEMTWMYGMNRAYASLCAYIADHGHVDEKSVMALGLGFDKKLRYKNLTDLAQQNGKATLYWGGPPTSNGRVQVADPNNMCRIISHAIKSSAGLQNNLYGYGASVAQDVISGATEIFGPMLATLMSNNLGMSSALKSELGTVRTEIVPPSGGNTSKRFESAKMQNNRGHSTFSTAIEVLVAVPTDCHILDVVDLYFHPGADQHKAQSYNGRYIVKARNKIIRANTRMFNEKLRLESQGQQNSSGMVTA